MPLIILRPVQIYTTLYFVLDLYFFLQEKSVVE